MLDSKPAPGMQVIRRLTDQDGQIRQAVVVGNDRRGGFVLANGGCQRGIVAGDVWRVAHQAVETLIGGKGVVPAALTPAYAAEGAVQRIPACNIQCGRGPVGANDLPGGSLQGQRQGHGAATRTQVSHALWALAAHLQGRFNQGFGIGSRDEHVWRHAQAQLPEVGDAADIGIGLATGHALNPVAIALFDIGWRRILGVGAQPDQRAGRGIFQEKTGALAVIQSLLAPAQQIAVAAHASSLIAASCSAWYSANSGSMTWSIAPSMISASL